MKHQKNIFSIFFLFMLIFQVSYCQLFEYLSKESEREKAKRAPEFPRFEEFKVKKSQFIDILLSQANTMISSRNRDMVKNKFEALKQSLSKGKHLITEMGETNTVRVPYLKVKKSLFFGQKMRLKIGQLELSIPEFQMIILTSTRLLKACGKNIENCLIKDNDLEELTLDRKEKEEERETMKYLKKSAMDDLNEYSDLDEELNGVLHPHEKNKNSISIDDFEDSLNF